ncbi:Cationic amino acid transporter 7, chloroplastic [Dichanthelium oligosanthes]|uniref:Cationic amino acid transporter 7, chloroplastic n=1 Tax=Dichanthelium oligosanthes TaxID=888268 RepID=A0A1E5VLU7_9POAL|nr:Cationic amino acid transporter 7, chloroplastic [Dichanthelium oligosanthes]
MDKAALVAAADSDGAARAGGSFTSLRVYGRALAQTPRRLARRAFAATAPGEEMSLVRARSGPRMARALRWFDLVGLGLGGMVGAGVFVTTGRATRLYAGPGVVVSYAIAGLCALLSAFCYTEFAVDMPVAGGAFSYLRVTFGELPFIAKGELAAFLTGANLIMEYVFSNAAVARSFTAYLGTAVGVDAPSKWRIPVPGLPEGFNQVDLVAVGVILLISVCICYSTKESSLVNLFLTGVHVLFILFIIAMGFKYGDARNLTRPADPVHNPGGFFPHGAAGVFNGAAAVYLSYIGYDAVSTMAEEVERPARDIPIGVSGSVVVVTALYCLMAASMSMLLPYDTIDPEAPFSEAFKGKKGKAWVSNVIGAGASLGILTSLMVAMLGQARYLCVIGRSGVMPAWLARVHPRTATPVNASVFLGLLTAALALFTELDVLLNLVSIGTLFVFYMVGNAVVYRRYVGDSDSHHVEPQRRRAWPALAFLGGFSLTALSFTLVWQLAPAGGAKAGLLSACAAAAVATVAAFQALVPQAGRAPELWGVPGMPWVPAASVFLNVFLLGSLDRPSYVRFGVFSAAAVLVYALYSVHASYDAEEESGGGGGGGKVQDEECKV